MLTIYSLHVWFASDKPCCMKSSSLRHPVAVLRQLCGMYQQQFADEIAGCSRIYLQKIEQTPAFGGQKISERLAMQIAHNTGVSIDWLLAADPAAPPVDELGSAYTPESFEWHRAGFKKGEARSRSIGFPLRYAMTIAGIGCAAGNQGKAKLFMWRLREFLDRSSKEFGFDREAFNSVGIVLGKAKLLHRICFHDKGFDLSILSDPRIKSAITRAAKNRMPGDQIRVDVTLPPESRTKGSSRRPRKGKSASSVRRPSASRAGGNAGK